MTRIITDETHALRRRVERLEEHILDLRAALGRLSPRPVAAQSVPMSAGAILAIVDRVSEAHGVTTAEIFGPRRDAHIIAARFECYAHAENSGFSLQEISRSMRKDRTSVRNGITKWKFRNSGT